MSEINTLIDPEDVRTNNTKVLKQRRRFFTKELKSSIEFLIYIYIMYVYFLDYSLFALIIKLFIQSLLSSPFPNQNSSSAISAYTFLPTSSKYHILKVVFYVPFWYNSYIIISRLLFGDYKNRTENSIIGQYIYGGYTSQIIGEPVCRNVWKIVFYDSLIELLQFLLFCIEFLENYDKINESLLEEGTIDREVVGEKSLLEQLGPGTEIGDGYSGETVIFRLSPRIILQRLWSWKIQYQIVDSVQ